MTRRKDNSPKKKSFLRDWVVPLIWAVVLAGVLRATVVGAYHIPSGSMEPTLLIGDHLLVNKLAYGVTLPFSSNSLVTLGEPERGDVVVFAPPEGQGPDWIKRVIGLPGETVLVSGRSVFINGKKLNEPWAYYTGGPGSDRPGFGPVMVPKGKYFVLGDNRDNSYDSRFWHRGRGGFVPLSDIRGRAMVIHFSWRQPGWGVRWARTGRLIN